MAISILRHEGCKAFYRGFGTSLMGTIPARALYMEITKSNITYTTVKMGFSEVKAAAIGLSAAMVARLVWTPIDVVSQRLMVQGRSSLSSVVYNGGTDAFRRVIQRDGVKGLYKGFGISILTYAPTNAVWWASYTTACRWTWGGLHSKKKEDIGAAVMAVQGLSATLASGVSALVTMPLDTMKTRLQVLERGERESIRKLVREGGFYRGLGPRWASMSLSATTTITTYEDIY